MKGKNKFYILISLSFLVLIFPALVFIYNFKNHTLSKEISDWASLGDYLGGTVNTLISFLSLIILGWLTYLVNKNSIDENKKLNILQRKFDAYHELTSYSPLINANISSISRSFEKLTIQTKIASNINDVNFTKAKDEVIKNSQLFIEFYYYVFSFNIRYGHIFEYDFEGDEFQSFISVISDFNNYFKTVIDKFEIDKGDVPQNFPDIEKYAKNFASVSNSLRNEITLHNTI